MHTDAHGWFIGVHLCSSVFDFKNKIFAIVVIQVKRHCSNLPNIHLGNNVRC
ncbi:hypothetical protein FIS3754_37090 [Fischerella sp. NIES-3754]|nr:hypothetical protein FIS3754_37090 [Fischerella sp. NIES-3754]BCX10123.1 MAG: hypothetical protein KatS3mg066_3982 [Fischerella sp.]